MRLFRPVGVRGDRGNALPPIETPPPEVDDGTDPVEIPGFVYLIDDAGSFLTDDSGAFLITEVS